MIKFENMPNSWVFLCPKMIEKRERGRDEVKGKSGKNIFGGEKISRNIPKYPEIFRNIPEYHGMENKHSDLQIPMAEDNSQEIHSSMRNEIGPHINIPEGYSVINDIEEEERKFGIELMEDLKSDLIKLKTWSSRKALFFKYLNYFISFITIVGGYLFGVVEYTSDTGSSKSYFIMVGGPVISTIKLFYDLAQIPKVAIFYKNTELRAKKLLASTREVSLYLTTGKEMARYVYIVQAELDDMELDSFKNEIPTEGQKNS